MRVTKRSTGEERRILTAMIVSDLVLARISTKWEKGLFRSKWANLVAQWCVEYFNNYGKAPRGNIQPRFESWSTSADEKQVELIGNFLDGLSKDYERLNQEINADYVTDLAASHFNKNRLTTLRDQIEGDLEAGDLESAQKRVHNFHRVEIGQGSGIDPFHDDQAIKEALSSRGENVVKYPDALGVFFNKALERDAFISFMASEKRGKSWWLLDLAWRAIEQKRKVAFFEVGDMSQNQVMKRLLVRASRRPIEPGTVKYPILLSEDGIEHKTRTFKKSLSLKQAKASMGKQTQNLFRLSCHPTSTLSVKGIRSILEGWEREEWVPDVVVIDYADILAPPHGVMETRDQVNATWKQLRALSQELHCLVVTATQADASSYSVDVVNRSNFSEDKRKLAHVTGMVGINGAPKGMAGIMRLNWVVLREAEFTEGSCVATATCLSIGNPAVRSAFLGDE